MIQADMFHTRDRFALLVVWFSCFFVNVALALYLYMAEWISNVNFEALLLRINGLYAPYLGSILTFYFAVPVEQPHATGSRTPVAFILALLCSAGWNLILVALLARVVFFDGYVEDAMKDMELFGSPLAWLVAPAIAYYFARTASH